MMIKLWVSDKGLIQLAMRSGQYKKLNVVAIKENELISYNALDEEIEVSLIEDDEIRENAETIGYYAMFEYINGFKKSIYWSKKKMLAHADKYSQAFDKEIYVKLKNGEVIKDSWKYSSFWYKDFDGMAFKTLLRQLISKWGIMSTDLQEAYEKDMSVIHDNGQSTYVENIDFETKIINESDISKVEYLEDELKGFEEGEKEDKTKLFKM